MRAGYDMIWVKPHGRLDLIQVITSGLPGRYREAMGNMSRGRVPT